MGELETTVELRKLVVKVQLEKNIGHFNFQRRHLNMRKRREERVG